MPDALFQSLSARDRRDALEVAAGLSGRRAQLLKPIWPKQDSPLSFALKEIGCTSAIRRCLPTMGS